MARGNPLLELGEPAADSGKEETASRFVRAFTEHGSRHFARNIQTRMGILRVAGETFPVSVNDGQYGNALSCSPSSIWIRLPADLYRQANAPISQAMATIGGAGLAPLFIALRFNRVVRLNDWLGLTRSFGSWRGRSVASLTRELARRFPRHAVLIPRIVEILNPGLAQTLERAGFRVSPRQTSYVLDGRDPEVPKRRNNQRDFRLVESDDFEFVDHEGFRGADFAGCARLYREIYIRKYSPLAARYTPAFFELCHRLDLLRFRGFRGPGGRLIAMIGIAEDDAAMYASILGYDRTLPKERGLYRRLMALVIREACRRGIRLYLGSGAAGFKTSRGAEPHIQWGAVYARHLPVLRQGLWDILNVVGKARLDS